MKNLINYFRFWSTIIFLGYGVAYAQSPSAAEGITPKSEWSSAFHEAGKVIKNSVNIAGQKINEELKVWNQDLNPELATTNNSPYRNSNTNYHVYNSDWDTKVSEDASYEEKRKVITKNYTVSSKDKLSIGNKFGKVEVNTWSRNEIKVEVTVISYRSSAEKAQRELDNILIEESLTEGLISLKTIFKNTVKNETYSKGEKSGMEINYLIYMPEVNPLTINNKFGNTKIVDFKGPVNLTSKYGSLVTGRLQNNSNTIEASYGSVIIESIEKGTIDASYGSLKINKTQTINIEHKYGSLDLGDIGYLTATIAYSNVNIKKLDNMATVVVKYAGEFNIDEVSAAFKSLNFTSSYSNIKLGLPDGLNGTFDINTSYGDFKYSSQKVAGLKRLGDEDECCMKYNYTGRLGNGTGGSVLIKSSYGNVRFD